MIHWQVSVASHVAANPDVSASCVLVLSQLWGRVRDPFAEQPVVTITYAKLGELTGLGQSALEKATCWLNKRGCLRKPKTATIAGIAYVLLRPKHVPTDAERNPFDPSEHETIAAEVVETLRADGRVVKPKVAAVRPVYPAVEPSKIACRLEDVAGIEPRFVDGKRKPSIPFSDRCGGKPYAVRAAQSFIVDHGERMFVRVCELAADRPMFDRKGEPLPAEKRAHFFERKKLVRELVAELRLATGEREVNVKRATTGTPVVVQPEVSLTEDQIRWRMLAESVP